MAITIVEAARLWHINREKIYQRQLTGQLRFATIDPPTVEASEMLRVFGKPRPSANAAAARSEDIILQRVEAVCDILRTAVEELDRLVGVIAAQRLAIETQLEESSVPLQRGETGEAQAVLSAQLAAGKKRTATEPNK